MEREIKFRGKRIDNGEWVVGNLIGKDVIVGEIIDWEHDFFTTEFWRKVDPKTVGQFTLYRDKNGVDVYEGDILSEKWKTEVYNNKEGTYMVRFHNHPDLNKPKTIYHYLKGRDKAGTSERDCVIIGNIYDNPELL